MKGKLQNNVFFKMNSLDQKVNDLQRQILELNEKLETYQEIERCHLLRIKNGETLSDDYILNGRKYNDMSPEAAFRYFEQEDIHYILLDVSSYDFSPKSDVEEATKIPFEDLNIRYKEIQNKATPLLVICEDGTQSILACEFLNQMGFYNVNNVSGGYKYWPGFQTEKTELKIAS